MLKNDLISFLSVFVGGGLGSVFRFLLSRFSILILSNGFPLATLIANICSTLILACLVYFFQSKALLGEGIKLLLITGFCGGFSTFSTFSYETFELINAGETVIGLLNILINVGVCVFLVLIVWKFH